MGEYKYNIENSLVSYNINLSDIQIIPISSKTGYGLNDLMDAIDLQSQLMDLRSTSESKNMEGIVLEARKEKGLGIVVDIIVRDVYGLKVGGVVKCFESGIYGKVERLIDVNGKSIKEAKPSQPVRIIGLKSIPKSGESIITVDNEDIAKSILEKKFNEQNEDDAAAAAISAAS